MNAVADTGRLWGLLVEFENVHDFMPAVAKVREDAPFDKICYIGCGVTTGIGAVAFTMNVASSTIRTFILSPTVFHRFTL